MWLPLDHLLEELWGAGPITPQHLAVLFGVFERFPTEDGAGVLWSIVHGVESLPLDYEPSLRESWRRVPSQMAEIMLVRLENAGKGT
jgi:hypothetical protein